MHGDLRLQLTGQLRFENRCARGLGHSREVHNSLLQSTDYPAPTGSTIDQEVPAPDALDHAHRHPKRRGCLDPISLNAEEITPTTVKLNPLSFTGLPIMPESEPKKCPQSARLMIAGGSESGAFASSDVKIRPIPASLVRALSKAPADLTRELLEVFETILQEIVNSAPIDFEVIVHQDVPQACHRKEPLRELCRQISALTGQRDRVPMLLHGTQPVAGHNVVGNIKGDLDGEPQVSLNISNHKRILDKLLTRPAARTPQQSDASETYGALRHPY